MSEMVERVARAICKSHGFHEDAPARKFGALNDHPMWRTYERDAIDAIKAMREPTQTMAMEGYYAGGCEISDEETKKVYSRMIEEALK